MKSLGKILLIAGILAAQSSYSQTCIDTCYYIDNEASGDTAFTTDPISGDVSLWQGYGQGYYFSGPGSILGASCRILLDFDGVAANHASVAAVMSLQRLDVNDMPDSVLAVANITIADAADGYQYFAFSSSVSLSGNFGVTIEPVSVTDTVYPVSSLEGDGGLRNLSYLGYAGVWYSVLTDNVPNNHDVDYYILPVMSLGMTPAFTASTDSICEGSSVSFTNSSSGNVDTMFNNSGSIGYVWDFDDANFSTVSDPSHLYSGAGVYDVMLYSTLTGWTTTCVDSFGASITVSAPATAAAGGDSTICATDTYTLSGSIGGGASSSVWTTFGTGTFSDSSLLNAVYTPSAADTDSVCVVLKLITNAPGACPSVSDVMLLCFTQCGGGAAPVPGFTAASTSICEGACINFSDTSTNSPTSRSWTFTGGTPSSSTDQNPTICYSSAGSYDVKLVVTNGNGSDSVTMANYIVVGAAATASAGADVAICAGSTYTLAGSIGGSASSSTWSSSGTGTFSDANSLTAVYTPSGADTVAGSVTITVVTDDPAGACPAGTDDMVFTINARPIAGFTFVATMLDVVFANTTTGGATYAWVFGDGNVSTAASPSNTYATAGTYTACVTATSSAGCMNEKCMPVTVTTGTGISDFNAGMDISVYPNPTKGEFTLAFDQLAKGNIAISIYGITGQVVHSESMNNFSGSYEQVIDLSAVGSGIYYLEIKTESHIARYKIAVQ